METRAAAWQRQAEGLKSECGSCAVLSQQQPTTQFTQKIDKDDKGLSVATFDKNEKGEKVNQKKPKGSIPKKKKKKCEKFHPPPSPPPPAVKKKKKNSTRKYTFWNTFLSTSGKENFFSFPT